MCVRQNYIQRCFLRCKIHLEEACYVRRFIKNIQLSSFCGQLNITASDEKRYNMDEAVFTNITYYLVRNFYAYFFAEDMVSAEIYRIPFLVFIDDIVSCVSLHIRVSDKNVFAFR